MVVSGVGESYPRREFIPAFIAGKNFRFARYKVGVIVLRGRRDGAVASSPALDRIAWINASVGIVIRARPVAIKRLLARIVTAGEHLAHRFFFVDPATAN